MYTQNGLMCNGKCLNETGTDYDEKHSAGLCVKREVYYEVTSVIVPENVSAAEYDKGGEESHEQGGLFDDDYGGDELADNDVIGHVEQVNTDSYEDCEEFGDVKTPDESNDDKKHGYEGDLEVTVTEVAAAPATVEGANAVTVDGYTSTETRSTRRERSDTVPSPQSGILRKSAEDSDVIKAKQTAVGATTEPGPENEDRGPDYKDG
ncbi:hypothetical protein PInf_005134 [Phytophthora infestans]|nr:hypothetical protein PInf_008073 [Phytophthora infestans]KAI9985732.1 hypothetical protein PInf_005134 [Phytophthora infestans]